MAFRQIGLKSYTRFMKFYMIRRDLSEGGGNETKGKKGLVLGVYYDEDEKEHVLTDAARKFDNQTCGKLSEILKDGMPITKGNAVLFQNLDGEFYSVAIAGLGPENVGYNALENLDECKENIRVASGIGALKLKELGISKLYIEGMGNSESAAEGSLLAVWNGQELKSKNDRDPEVSLELYHDSDQDGWKRGLFKADAQNLARRLSDLPANHLTPTIFAGIVADVLCPCGVSVEVRDKDWLALKKMRATLAVARGSTEPPIFLELSYCGGDQDDKTIAFVGKGITFDAGGLCLKKCPRMKEYRADMAGAAVIVAVMRACAAMNLSTNLSAAIPLCENVPSGMCMKPGDIVTSFTGKNIQIEDTDNEGRLLLADALAYANQNLNADIIIDVATMTRGMRSALGGAASGVYTNNHDLWWQLSKAGSCTGDRVWRFPIWQHFTKKVTDITSADLTNVGKGPGGGPCRAAAFLNEFISCVDWVHMDITSCGMLSHWEDYPYLTVGRMTGRPTRTLIQLIYQMVCLKDKLKKPEEKLPCDQGDEEDEKCN